YNRYNELGSRIESHSLESQMPVPISQFQKSTYSILGNNYNVIRDGRYNLKQLADYYQPGQYLKELTTNGSVNSFIVDTLQGYPTAATKNASHSATAYTSFENNSAGNWSITGGLISNVESYTGRKSLNTSGATVQ